MIAVLALTAAVGMAQAPAVEGVVRSTDGEPIPYAQVRVVDDSTADWTDDAGHYVLDGLPRGSWHVQVVHPRHDSLDLDVFVPGNRSVRLDITLAARPLATKEPLFDFQPFQVEYTLPVLLNPHEVSRLIQERYSTLGIEGEVVLMVWLDERGQVVRSTLSSSSGVTALDSIVLDISDRMRFRPARSGDYGVRVIVRVPVSFTIPDLVEDSSASAEGVGGEQPSRPGR